MPGQIKDHNNIPQLIEDLRSIENKTVFCGIFGEENSEVLQYAGAHEFGARIKVTEKMRARLHYEGIHLKKETTEIILPERSFLRATFDRSDVKEILGKELERALMDFLQGLITAIQILHRLGLRMVAEVKKRIVDNNPAFKPLSSATINRKGSDKALIDTKRLFNSIGYRIEGISGVFAN
ncbi:MAG: hypothetical protein K8R21_08720 [Leptospira sp.]|nr:hypothetical protein [Leptospira sp.]